MKRKHSIHGLIYSLLFCLTILFPSTVFAETRTVTAHIPVSCTGKNTDEEFTYTLTGKTADQNVDKDVIKPSNSEKGSFDINYSYPGTYWYEIKQTSGSDAKTIYDNTVYKVAVYVTNGDAELQAEVIAYKDGHDEKVNELSFVNKRENDVKAINSTTNDIHKNAASVKTGDTANLRRNLFTVTLSFGMIILLLQKRRRVCNEKEKKRIN